MTGVESSAALAKLTVSVPTLEKDGLLSLVSSLASPYQLSLNVKKTKGTDLSLELSDGSATLTHRNAILRSLCGMGLHNALDSRYHLLGAHSSRSLRGSSPQSAIALAGIASWMSVADSIRTGSGGASTLESLNVLLGQLDAYLASRSYLVPSPSATLADLDLALAIGAAAGDDLDGMVGSARRSVRRWLVQCDAAAADLVAAAAAGSGGNGGGGGESSSIPEPKEVEGWIRLKPAPRAPAFFFYGDEGEIVAVTATATATATSPSAPASAAVAKSGDDSTKKKGAGDSNKKKGGNSAGKAEGGKKADGQGGGGGGGGGEPLTDEQKKAAAEKRAKAKAEKSSKKGQQPKGGDGNQPPAEFDISAMDIRVGRILKAWNHEEAEKLYCEEVDVGEPSGPRKIASGLRPFYSLEEMQDRRVLVLCNLKARNLVGFPSHGMVLCASNADHTLVEFAVPPEGAKIGERVMFEGLTGEPEPENKVAKKKIFEKVAPDLKTDGEGVVVWNGKKGLTSAGPCRALNGMKDAQVA